MTEVAWCSGCGAAVAEHPDKGNGPYWWPLYDDEPCADENGLPAPHTPDWNGTTMTKDALTTKADYIRAANARWEHQHPDEVEPEIIEALGPDDDFLLVERSRITNEYHLSTHETLAEVSRYSASQECAEDWEPRIAVDLVEGSVYELVQKFRLDSVLAAANLTEFEEWRK